MLNVSGDTVSVSDGTDSVGVLFSVVISWRNGDSFSQSVVSEAAAKAKQDAEDAAAAQQAAEAAAQQAAEQAAQQASQSAGSTAGGKTEVSRQAYDDCDGSGHGYYEITYSDGSTAIEEY